MNAHRLFVRVDQKNGIQLKNLPFKAGQRVEVILVPEEVSKTPKTETRSPVLEGTLLKYEHPFESATDASDWEVFK